MASGDDELIEAGDRNLRGAWHALASSADGATIEEDDDLLLLASNAPLAFFNPAFLKRPATGAAGVADAPSLLDRIHRFYGREHLPFVVWVREGTHGDLVEQAIADGLRANDGPPGMIMQPIGGAPAGPDGLEVLRVDSGELLGSTVDVVAAGFDMPIDLCHRLLQPALLANDRVAVFVGRVDGYPVSTAALIVTESDLGPVAGIYNVATPQGNRGRGFGEAVTWAAVTEGAQRGCALANLQASPMGYGIYERMGFRPVCSYRHLVGGP